MVGPSGRSDLVQRSKFLDQQRGARGLADVRSITSTPRHGRRAAPSRRTSLPTSSSRVRACFASARDNRPTGTEQGAFRNHSSMLNLFSERVFRRASIAIALTGLITGAGAWANGRSDLASWCWAAGTLPVVIGLLISMIRDFFDRWYDRSLRVLPKAMQSTSLASQRLDNNLPRPGRPDHVQDLGRTVCGFHRLYKSAEDPGKF